MYKIFQPMKYYTTKKQELLKEALESDDYALQRKVDGASYVWAKDEDGSVHLYGDKISKKTGEIIDKIDNLPHLKAFAEAYFPKGSQLIVEICYPYSWSGNTHTLEDGTNSKFVNSIMLSTPEKAIFRQERTKLCTAYVFDMLYWHGEEVYKLDFADRYERCWILSELPEYKDTAWLSFAENVYEDKTTVLADWLANGEEGGVLKLLRSKGRVSAAHAVSEIGATAKRPAHSTYKIKQLDTADVVIIGVEWPTKEYKGKLENATHYDEEGNPVNRLWALGMVNALKIGFYDEEKEDFVQIGTVASGLDDELRLAFAKDEVYYFGKVIECECMSIDTQAMTLRHPRFIRFRPDKSGWQCLKGDIFHG